MVKKLIVGGGIVCVLTAGIIIGSITLGTTFAQAGNNNVVGTGTAISSADAEAIVLAANPGTGIVESDLEKENGILVYSIDLDNGIEVAVNASTGEILQNTGNGQESSDTDYEENESGENINDQDEVDEQQSEYEGSIQINGTRYEGLSEADEAARLQALATISSSEAEAAALAANPGTSVVKSALENENGTLVYSVELSNGNEVKIDAGTTKVLHTEVSGHDEDVGEAEED
jgi:uncharacterized membrane protein YkoI